jgi:hypothetical protein
LANRSARNLSVFSRTNRALAWYSVIAIAPSLARSSFLKLASARARASSIPVVKLSPIQRTGASMYSKTLHRHHPIPLCWQQFEAFTRDFHACINRRAGDVPAGPRKAGHNAICDWVRANWDHRDALRSRFDLARYARGDYEDQVRVAGNDLTGQLGELRATFAGISLDRFCPSI